MIYVLEGIDMAGKSTLYDALRGRAPFVRFVHRLRVPLEMRQHMPWIELKELSMWEGLWDEGTAYVCDRHAATSAPVYNELHGRRMLANVEPWHDRIHVLRLCIPRDVFLARLEARGDEEVRAHHYDRITWLYDQHLARFPRCTHLDGTLPTHSLVEIVLGILQVDRLSSPGRA